MSNSERKKIIHVVSVSFSLSYFVGKQFHYFKKSNPAYDFYVACSPSENLDKMAKELAFIAVPLVVTRTISPIQDLKSIFKLAQFIKKNEIAIVVGHTPKGGLIAMLAGTLAGVKQRIYFRHGIMYETSKGFKRTMLKTIERITGFFATLVVCVSEEIKTISTKEYLSADKKNLVLGRGTCNGVDCLGQYNPENSIGVGESLRAHYQIDKDVFVLGYVGRLVKDKGINELVAAWQLVHVVNSKKRLLLVGPLEERDPISEKTRQLILTDPTIIYTGFVDDASAYYQLMNAFVLPSYREGFPTVILEASSMELPVLTTRATGCKEAIIEGQTGMFFEIEENKIAEAINYIIKHPNEAKLMGENGRKYVSENFEQTTIWNIIERNTLVL